ncbi:glycosyltransferase [Conexibacter sp. JD483]|uniref:glycosyltransferase family protein n=1 Tax=unclassified Conexibacter TaxID=2627773 RepID=UPI00271F382B|nr:MULTISPECIES: glycosyltransferase [unclassified Conexibacter]MDO8188894.1 glycosyltransferase [Conexibacter sp. CPCC 205706]MDO8201684.1 glycosyltransferase [Conexibacter sp. CPCC 205762]MDR9372146.1 glycosyltransferase [Conexibacter sp. JD483]
MEALARRGHSVHVEELNLVDRPDRFREFDIVFFWRCYFWPMQQLAQRLRHAHVPMVWDNDDDLTAIPKDNPAYQKTGGFRGRRASQEMARMMRMADVVTTTTPTLAERYRELSGVEARVIENYLRPGFGAPRRVAHDTVTIGWLAALEHRMDYERLGLHDVFVRLLATHPQVRLVSIGLKLKLDHPHYRHIDITPYERIAPELAKFDVGLAPLADIAFNRGRSSVKLKEYSACGVPWLASPVGPYAELGPQEGGQLVADDGWYEALEALIGDLERRRRLGANAKSWAQRQTIVHHVQEWEAVLRDAVKSARMAATA